MDATIVTAPEIPTTKIAVTSEVDTRFRWHVAAWVVLFILLIASWFAIGALIFNETKTVRQDSQQANDRLWDKMNEGDTSAQSRIDSRATTLDARVDALLRDNAMLHAELSALMTRVAQQQDFCRNDCTTDK